MKTEYKRPFSLLNGHFETIYPALFRKVRDAPTFRREELSTPDGDFLEVDWATQGSKKILILQHGLEGSSNKSYILGMSKIFYSAGYDICAWNYRGCGAVLNKQPIFYHSGATYDLDLVISHVPSQYEDITLLGFSLGGNLTLKYMGENDVDPRVKRSIAISVPLDLSSSADNLATAKCYLYEKRFLRNLIKKVKLKDLQLPYAINMQNIQRVKSLRDFDEYFTAPIHGFKGADDYYRQNSARFYLKSITKPTLVINAQNDPMLSSICFDPKVADNNPHISFLFPKHGGHVGFAEFGKDQAYWSEKKALEFAQTC